MCIDALHEAVTEYGLVIGESRYCGVPAYLSGAETARSTLFVEENRYKLPGNGKEIMDLPTEQAVAIIKERLGGAVPEK